MEKSYRTMTPVSDPENWTTFRFAPMIGFAMHNAPYRITVQWRYGVYMKGQEDLFKLPSPSMSKTWW